VEPGDGMKIVDFFPCLLLDFIPYFNLLNEYVHKQNYEIIAEITCMGAKGKPVRPDGIVKNLN
jgi:hypothetical protein